jgi:hypothetical protein
LLGARMWVLFVLLVIVLLLVFPRQILPILVGAAVLLGGVGGWYFWDARQLAQYQEAVLVDVAYAPEDCSPARPLRLTIQNESPLTVARVQWQFSARRAGYRGELTGGWTTVYAVDEPLDEGQTYQQCYAAPQPTEHVVKRDSDELENLVLGIRDKQVTFVD